MKHFKMISVISIIISLFLSFSIFAMPSNQSMNEPERATPLTETKSGDRDIDYRWTWISDDICVQFKTNSYRGNKERLQQMYDNNVVLRWYEDNTPKKRYTYAGKWSQDTADVWSFIFDDCTIPVGITKIDGVLYAFNSFGELKEGYSYYDKKEGNTYLWSLKTAADGLVATDNAELNKWLETEYLPDCTSHK